MCGAGHSFSLQYDISWNEHTAIYLVTLCDGHQGGSVSATLRLLLQLDSAVSTPRGAKKMLRICSDNLNFTLRGRVMGRAGEMLSSGQPRLGGSAFKFLPMPTECLFIMTSVCQN